MRNWYKSDKNRYFTILIANYLCIGNKNRQTYETDTYHHGRNAYGLLL